MARGRKRLIAGWGLVGVGIALAAIVVASGRWSAWLNCGSFWLTASRGSCLYSRTQYEFHPWEAGYDTNSRFELHWWNAGRLPRSWVVDFRSYPGFGGGPGPRVVDVLLWPFALAFLLSGAACVKWGRTRGLSPPGLCPTCGYDMKGLAAGAGCPECGKAAAAR